MNTRPTQLPASETIPWHARDTDFVLREWTSSPEGLSSDQAAQRLATHGENRLPPAKRASPLIRFLNQFNNLLT